MMGSGSARTRPVGHADLFTETTRTLAYFSQLCAPAGADGPDSKTHQTCALRKIPLRQTETSGLLDRPVFRRKPL